MRLVVIVSTVLVWCLVSTGRVRRQDLGTRQLVEVECSACQRLKENPPEVCCRCIDQGATCNNDIAIKKNDTFPGLICGLECELFNDCAPNEKGCKVSEALTVVDIVDVVDLRGNEPPCPAEQKMCCNPGPGGGFLKQLELEGNDLTGQITIDTAAICNNNELSAVQDFGHGVQCGKRDSRVYFDASVDPGYTNPGEWPWAVMLYKDGIYIGAGAFMDNDVVVTVGHKVKDFVVNPRGLTVRLGDWNPNEKSEENFIEEYQHIEVPVKCVKLHPEADLEDTLAYNVAVLKLGPPESDLTNEVSQVVDIRLGPKRPANKPEGVEGFSVINGVSELDEVLGFVSDVPSDGLGLDIGLRQNVEIPRSYINTVCLPTSQTQFEFYTPNCWVAAWGMDLKRQREVYLPLVNKTECERRLGPVFKDRGIPNWELKPSELCAGGVPDKDTCEGEGGAPLVCYDQRSDQFFAVGLVSYGFGCNTSKPAIYTNLADPAIKQFIEDASSAEFC